MDADEAAQFVLEDLTVGAYAHGFGRNPDGEVFAFRVRRSTLRVEVYRHDLETDVPDSSDVVATAEFAVTDVDLTDERSVAAVVRDAVATAERTEPAGSGGLTVRAILSRLSAVIDVF